MAIVLRLNVRNVRNLYIFNRWLRTERIKNVEIPWWCGDTNQDDVECGNGDGDGGSDDDCEDGYGDDNGIFSTSSSPPPPPPLLSSLVQNLLHAAPHCHSIVILMNA